MFPNQSFACGAYRLAQTGQFSFPGAWFTSKGYAKVWWWQLLRTALLKYGHLHLVPQYMVHKWEGEARVFRETRRPARAVHFAPAFVSP